MKFATVFLLLILASCQQAPRTCRRLLVEESREPDAAQQLIDDSKSFTRIPGIVNVSAGRVLPSTRPAVDSSFDVAIVMKFRDEKALLNYGQNPIHLAAVERTLKPLVAKYVIYDYGNEI